MMINKRFIVEQSLSIKTSLYFQLENPPKENDCIKVLAKDIKTQEIRILYLIDMELLGKNSVIEITEDSETKENLFNSKNTKIILKKEYIHNKELINQLLNNVNST